MRAEVDSRLNEGRIRDGMMGSDDSWGHYGSFMVRGPCGEALRIVASGADDDDTLSQGWEHVSVSCRKRCPNWPEMCFVKGLFWRPDEAVVQFHPPESEYVNNHPFCLHLFRDKRRGHQLPPSILVGFRSLGTLEPSR